MSWPMGYCKHCGKVLETCIENECSECLKGSIIRGISDNGSTSVLHTESRGSIPLSSK